MRLKCFDGVVRNFIVAHADGDRLPDGTHQDGFSEAVCDECGHIFGCHDTKILKSRFISHKCSIPMIAERMLRGIAYQLEKWADESREGGWSTHQVKPMRDKAAEIFAFLGRGENK